MAGTEPYENALGAIPGAHPYPRTSRYHDAEIGVHRQADGTEVRYTKRRLLPPLDQQETQDDTVGAGERPDLLAQHYFGDPAQWWRIADANPVLDPRELTDEAGRTIELPEAGEATAVSELPVGQGPVHHAPHGAQARPARPGRGHRGTAVRADHRHGGERSGFQLAFDLTKNGLINRRLLPEGFFDPKTRIIVAVSVRGTPDVLFDGLIVRQEVGTSNQPGHSTLTVTGEDLTLLLDLEERTARYPNLPPSERVLNILRRYSDYGIRPDVYTEKIAQPPHQDLRVHYQTGTDLQYVTELANANGYTFYLEPGPNPGQSSARWGPEVRLGIRQHALNVNMDANSTVDQLTFAYDGTAREEPQARWQDPGTRVSTLLPQPAISPLRPPLGRRPTPALKRKTLSGTAKQQREQAEAELLARAAVSADVVSGSGSLDVNRHGYILQPRQLVGVRGSGRAYDGDYYVKSVTHTLRPGSFQQNFTISREGLEARSDYVRP